MPDNIIIDFQVNDEGLQPVEDRLENLGKIDAGSAVIFKKTNTELQKRSALLKGIADGSAQVTVNATKEQGVYNKLVSSLKTLSGQSKTTVQDLLKLNPKEVAAGFEGVVTNVDDFIKVMQGASEGADKFAAKSQSLKQQLKTLTTQIAEMKLAGTDSGEAFNQLVFSAGKIKDALSDAGQEVRNFSSDTRTVDNVIGSVTALAGAFTAVQGASALFGDENKDLQETLVRVSAAMAVLQGVQQIQNALQKEGALSLLALNVQQRAAVLNTQLLVAAQSENVVVSGLATGAIQLLNAAMAANPIGLFITALVAVIGVFAFFMTRAHDAAVAQGELNQAIANGSEGLDAYVAGSKRGLDKVVSDLEKAGARQSEIQKQGGLVSADQINKRQAEIANLNKTILKYEGSTNTETVKLRGEALKQVAKLEQDNADAVTQLHVQQNAYDKQLIKENLEDQVAAQRAALANAQEGSRAQLAAQLALIRAQAALDTQDAGQDPAKVAAIQAQARKDQIETEVAFQRRLADLRVKDIDLQIEGAKNVDATNAEVYALEIKRITAQAAAEVLNTKLSAAEKLEIQKKADADRAAASKAFNEEDRKRTIQAEIDKNNAALAQRNISNADALALQEQNIVLAAQIEIDATKNNNEKVKLLYAQRDEQLRAARLASIRKELEEELALRTAANGPEVRGAAEVQTRLDDAFAKRKISAAGYYNYTVDLIKSQSKIDLDNNQLRIDALNKELAAKTISEKDYNAQYAQLSDDRAAIYDSEQEKIRAAGKKTQEQQKADAEAIKEYIVQTIGEVGNIALSVFQNQLDGQAAAIGDAKQRVEDLQKAGAITDKEAAKRMNDLAQQERRLKHDQAVKDKEAAIFNAVISTAGAVIKAYYQLGPLGGALGAAIVGAIGAAQIAVIASRPIPQFFRGKKPGQYEGWGSVAEHGGEMVVREDGTLDYQPKKQIVWLGKNDQVLTATETRKLMQTPTMRSNTVLIAPRETKAAGIDVDKLGKIIAANTKSTVIIDGIEAMIMDGLQQTNYITARRQRNK